jgi:YHS domain-containing protein
MQVVYFASIVTAFVLGNGLVNASQVIHAQNLASTSLQAQNPCTGKTPCAGQVFKHPEIYTENGVALDGQDVVAYFTENRFVPGKPQFVVRWKGVLWQFSSAKHRDLFTKEPAKYAPQYGGYCAKAASDGNLATTIPTAWEIRNGKLYLNYSAEAQQEWFQDTANKIIKADANWKGILANDTLYR